MRTQNGIRLESALPALIHNGESIFTAMPPLRGFDYVARFSSGLRRWLNYAAASQLDESFITRIRGDNNRTECNHQDSRDAH